MARPSRKSQLALLSGALLALAALVVGLPWLLERAGAPPAEPRLGPAPIGPPEEPAPRTEPDLGELDEPTDARVGSTTTPAPPTPSGPAGPLPPGVEGVVRDESGAPLAGVPVSIRLRQGPRRLEVGSAASGPHGRYVVELDRGTWESSFGWIRRRWADELEDADEELLQAAKEHERDLRPHLSAAADARLAPLQLCAEAELAGYQPARTSRRVEADPPARVRLDLVLRRGSGVKGRVFHRGGPVPMAKVHLFDGRWQLLRSTVTDLRGEYQLALSEPGYFYLHARRDGLGASGNSGFSLGEAFPPLEVDLDLDGLGALLGRVALADGTPIPNLRVQCLQEGLFQGEVFRGAHASFATIAQAEASGGLAACETTTDREGRFTLGGLQRSRFAVRFPGLDEDLQPQEIHATGAPEHEFALDVHLLAVSVRQDGRSRRRAGRRGARGRSRPPVEILCRPVDPPRDGERSPRQLGFLSVLDESATFLVEPGRDYMVLARGREAAAGAQVHIPPVRSVTEVVLSLRRTPDAELAFEMAAAPELGLLVLTTKADVGDGPAALRVTVRREGGSDPPIYDRRPFEAGDAGLPLYPEVYRVSVELEGRDADELAPPPELREVRVRPGETTRLELAFRLGGRLRLELAALAVPAGRERAAEVGLLLERLEGRARPQRPALALEGAPGATRLALSPGQTGTTPPLEPGPYRVTLESELVTAEPVELEIRAGETTRLAPELALRPLPAPPPRASLPEGD